MGKLTFRSADPDQGLVFRNDILRSPPHGAAWLVKIRLSNPGELANLLSAADYQNYIGAEK